jgi:O-antigen/teichoic acid export membrane protein
MYNFIMSSKYKNVLGLFLVKFISLGLKYIIILYLSSQILNPEEFGMFSLYLVILNIAYLFIGFGVIDTGMYLLSQKEDPNLCGVLFIVTIVITFLFTLLMMMVLKYYQFSHPIIIGLISGGYILNLFVKKISVSLHERFIMYYFEFFMYLFSFIGILLFADNVYSSTLIYSIVMLLVSIYFIYRLRPKFSNLTHNFKYLMRNIKSYGMKVHISQFISMGTYDSDKLMLQYIHGFSSVGIYNLALNFIMPVKLFSISISELMFKDFSKRKEIQKEVLLFNTFVSLTFSIFLSLAGYIIILNFYDDSYLEILKYIYLLPILAVLSSFYVPINNFFSAKGLAKEKFINAIVLAVCNVLFNVLFIPNFGVLGAILATIIALLFNNIMFFYQYQKFIRKEFCY